MAGRDHAQGDLLNLVIITCFGLVGSNSDFFGQDLFGVKTPYLWSRQNLEVSDLTTVQYNGQTCRVVYVDGVFRHGARYPLPKKIIRMNELHTLLKGGDGIDQSVVDWMNAFTADKAAHLSDLGQKEMVVLGERLGSRFQSFLSSKKDIIHLYSSSKDRARDSATYFRRGLGNKIGNNLSIPTTIYIDNHMLRFYDSCKLYNKIMDNEKTFAEYDKFLAGPEMTNVVTNVNNAVLRGHFNLTVEHVKLIQQMCAFELAFFNTSDWCGYLSLADLEVIDYAGDIQSYIEGGYQHKITAQMSCPLIKHILQQMDKVMTDPFSRPLASFRFTHVVSVLSLYTALGLFNESKTFLAKDYHVNTNRQYRASVIMPFSANVVTIMYKCDMEYMVKMMVNEKEVDNPACGAPMCPYCRVEDYYAQFVNCDFDDICENKGTNKGTTPRISGSVMIAILAFALSS